MADFSDIMSPYKPTYTKVEIDTGEGSGFISPVKNGKFIDHNGGKLGMGIRKKDRDDLIAAYQTTVANMKIAETEANAMMQTAAMEAEAAVQTAFANYASDVQTSSDNLEAVGLQTEADVEIAQMEKDWKLEETKNEALRINTVESVNANANQIAASATVIEAEAELEESEGEKIRDIAKANSGGGYSYYG